MSNAAFDMSRFLAERDAKTAQHEKPAHGGKQLYKAEYIDRDGNVERTLLSANDIPHAVQQLVHLGDVKHADQVTMVRRIGAPEFRSHMAGKSPPLQWHRYAETAPAVETPIVETPKPVQQPLFSDDMLADVNAYLNRCADAFRIGERRGDSIESIAAEIEKIPVPDNVTTYVRLVDKALLDI